MDTNQWTQEIGGGAKVTMADIASSTCSRAPAVMERKVRPQKDQALNCPRCHSTNTKFCYYNNYSLTQPRYFCKTCRRYWTEGGTLRNVPVGGGSRKNKRSSTTSSSSLKIPDLNPSNLSHQFNSSRSDLTKIHEGQDLNLGFPSLQEYHHGPCQFLELPKIETTSQLKSSSSSSATSTPFAALEMLRTTTATGIVSRGMNQNSFIATPAPDLNSVLYNTTTTTTTSSSGFSFQDLKPAVNFCVDGLGSRYGPSGVQENSGRLVFPFGAMKQLSGTNSEMDQNNKGHQNTNGYWNGMLGGGAW